MDINNLPQGYHKAVTESDFYIFDGQGVALPNEVKGRLLLIGCFASRAVVNESDPIDAPSLRMT